jgi:peptidyl-prolyl cis-trans isomerase B (cyclophilin B)
MPANQAIEATLVTSLGTMQLELWPDKAPLHVANFQRLAGEGFYDDLVFHRVIPDFMIQTGCPLGNGTGGPGWTVKAEFNSASFRKGTLGMARSQDPNSAGSQFFVCVADCAWLDGQYTAFGRVTEGQEVADAISKVPRDGQDRPLEDIRLTSVSVR